MGNETLQKILQKREIKTTDDIIFRTIFDVLSALFTDENHLSTLRSGYTINDHQQVWFPNITLPQRLAIEIKKGYANYMAPDGQYLYQFDSTKALSKRKKTWWTTNSKANTICHLCKIKWKRNGNWLSFCWYFLFRWLYRWRLSNHDL